MRTETILEHCYQVLYRNSFTRRITLRVRKQYEFLCPTMEHYIRQKTAGTILLTWGIMILEVVAILSMEFCLYHMLLAIVLAGILHSEVMKVRIRSLEIMMLKQFEGFIAEVRHSYYVTKSVDEAVYLASDQQCDFMRIQAESFYEILTSKQPEIECERYTSSCHNGFFNLFLALCITVMEYGDRKVKEQSVFLINLTNLRSEVNLELLKLKLSNYLYAGLSFVCVLPMCLLKVIERWSLSNLPELSVFYQGKKGTVMLLGIMILSLVLYLIIGDLREIRNYVPSDYALIDFLLEHRSIQTMMTNYINEHQKKVETMIRLIEESGGGISIYQLLCMKCLCALGTMAAVICVSVYFCISQWEGYDWYELIPAIIGLLVGFYLPQLRLLLRKYMILQGKEDEIIQFQSIVFMLMYIKHITVYEILERLEEFAFLYKKPIQNCINDYNSSEQKALEELKMADYYAPFQRFVDNLVICDEIGIERAFDEIAMDRQQFQEKRKQENEITLHRRYELANFLAFLPIGCVIGGYLILPFLMECYRELSEYSQMMNTFL